MEEHYRAGERDLSKASRWKKLFHNVRIQGSLGGKNKQMSDFYLFLLNKYEKLLRTKDQFTLLTIWLGLPVQVVEQLSVAGEHAATGGTGHQLLLSVAPHVLPQSVLDLEESVAACGTDAKDV